jgi:hypothetical protein
VPGPARKDEKLPDDPVIVGILAVIRGSKLRSQIARTYRSVLAAGREILEAQKAAELAAVRPAPPEMQRRQRP